MTDLEAEKLAALPADAQETIQTYKDRITLLEQEQESIDEIRGKLELAVELEKTKVTSLQDNITRLTNTESELNVREMSI